MNIVFDTERKLSAVFGYLVKPLSTSLVGNDKLSRDLKGTRDHDFRSDSLVHCW